VNTMHVRRVSFGEVEPYSLEANFAVFSRFLARRYKERMPVLFVSHANAGGLALLAVNSFTVLFIVLTASPAGTAEEISQSQLDRAGTACMRGTIKAASAKHNAMAR
jgi:hypothetical protein